MTGEDIHKHKQREIHCNNINKNYMPKRKQREIQCKNINRNTKREMEEQAQKGEEEEKRGEAPPTALSSLLLSQSVASVSQVKLDELKPRLLSKLTRTLYMGLRNQTRVILLCSKVTVAPKKLNKNPSGKPNLDEFLGKCGY